MNRSYHSHIISLFITHVLGVQRDESDLLHGLHLLGGEDRLLREAGGRVPEDGRHV